jgi:hypothetical protein
MPSHERGSSPPHEEPLEGLSESYGKKRSRSAPWASSWQG